MLIWVSALHCEAKPVIDYFRLRKSHASAPFDVYRGDGMCCVITGVGKLASAAACAWIAGREPPDAPLAWINLGCAGAATHDIGTAFVLDKIVDADSGQRFYPVAVAASALPSQACLTLAEPRRDYRDDSLYDMEASGFISSALHFSSAELVQAVKVISDNRSHQTGRDRAAVSRLIAAHTGAIAGQAAALIELQRELERRVLAPGDWQRLMRLAHFTQTQQNRLRVLWRYLRNREHSADSLLQQLSAEPSAGAMIATLERICHRDSEAL